MNMFKWLPVADLLLKKLMTVVIADLVAMQLNLKKKNFCSPSHGGKYYKLIYCNWL